MATRPASSDTFVQTSAEALNLDPSEVRRVVIDARPGHVLTIHVEKFGSTAMLEVIPSIESVEIRVTS